MLTQTFSPNTPDGLGRWLFCHSCFKGESLFVQAWFRFPVAAGVLHPGTSAQGTWQAHLLPYMFIVSGDSTSSPHSANCKETGQKRSKETIKCKRHYMMKHRGRKLLLLGGALFWRSMMNHIIPTGRSCPRPQITGLGSPWQLSRYTMFRGTPNFY